MNKLLSGFDEYLRLQRDRCPSTVKCYLDAASRLVDSLGGQDDEADERLRAATRSEVLAFLRQAAQTKQGVLSPHKWNQLLFALRSLFSYFLEEKHVVENPVTGIDPIEAESEKSIPLTLPEVAALVAAMRRAPEPYRSRNIALALVGFHCALRVGELHRLDLDHLDFGKSLIVNLLTKGKKFLVVPFPRQVAEGLLRCIAERHRFGAAAGEKAVFLSERGKRLSIRQMQEIVASGAEQAGIAQPVSPHVLRHSAATEHARLGTQPWDIQQLLGHASIATTQRYIHLMDTLRVAVDTLGEQVERLLQEDASRAPQSTTPWRGAPPLSGSSLLTGGDDTFPLSCGPPG